MEANALDALFESVSRYAYGTSLTFGVDFPFCTVRLYAPDSAAAARLNAHFEPTSPGRSFRNTVRVIIEYRKVTDRQWIAALKGSRVFRSTALGRGAFPVRWWPPNDARRCWAAEYTGTGHRLVRVDRGICILLDPDGPEPLRYAQRVLREVLIHAGRSKDYLLMHAAAVCLRGQEGVLLLGSGGSGKTDLAVRLGRSRDASLVAVDRLILGSNRQGQLTAVGLPFGFNVAWQTLQSIGLSTSAANRYGRFANGKWYLDQVDFSTLTRIPVQNECQVTRIIVLGDCDHIVTGPSDLTPYVRQHCLYGRDPGFKRDWLGLAGETSSLRTERSIVEDWPLDELAHRSAVIRHRPGVDTPSALTRLF